MIEMHRLKNVVIFIQTILSFLLSRKIIWIYAIFLFIVFENKNLKKVNLSDKLQCPHCQQL